MHNQFYVVTNQINEPNAILIRALEPMAGIEIMQQRRHSSTIANLTTGSGRLCQALGITAKQHNGIDLLGDTLWISPRQTDISPDEIVTSHRIGVAYAQEYAKKPWRFLLKHNSFISVKA